MWHNLKSLLGQTSQYVVHIFFYFSLACQVWVSYGMLWGLHWTCRRRSRRFLAWNMKEVTSHQLKINLMNWFTKILRLSWRYFVLLKKIIATPLKKKHIYLDGTFNLLAGELFNVTLCCILSVKIIMIMNALLVILCKD